MDKKQIKNKLNNQKGITAGDVMIALLIILTSLGVIAMTYTNLVTTSRGVDRKTGATRIATNILENMSQDYYDDIVDKIEENKDTILTEQEIFGTTIPEGYSVEITSEKPENSEYDCVIKAIVSVDYNVGGQSEKVTLSKVFEKELVRECNSPKFEDEYLGQLGVTQANSIMPWEVTGTTGQNDVSIICPVKYNGMDYEIIDEETELAEMWYSYSNKEWARVVILSYDEYSAYTIDPTIEEEQLTGANSYVWIPRFGLDNNGDVYFKYKGKDIAIKNSYYDSDSEMISNYLDANITWSSTVTFADGVYGEWVKYSDIASSGTNAYWLNQSRYGPILEH